MFVNYGLPEDYEKLDRLGISVKGAIVIAKYYHSWRGVKPKVAAEHGAIGCLIYSEPHDDGYTRGRCFPAGPDAESGRSAARQRDGFCFGESGRSAYARRRRDGGRQAALGERSQEHREDSGAADFLRRRAASAGCPQRPDGSGGMARELCRFLITLGPGPAKVHLKLAFNWDIKPVYDVIAKIPGSVAPDEWIIRGNHHDAWVNGAEDPVSGQAPLLEEARALGALLKQGWKPRRTIIYAAWDGEEPMLLGSTEWVEAHADELRQHAAVYINTDGNDRGLLNMGGSHTLEQFINGVARDIEDPETKMSVWQRMQLVQYRARNPPTTEKKFGSVPICESMHWDPARISPAFSIISASRPWISATGAKTEQGIYHSIYDDFLLVHAFFRQRFCVRAGAFADRGNIGDAAGRRGSAAL